MTKVKYYLRKLKQSKKTLLISKLLLLLFNCIILLNINTSCSKDKNKKEALEFFTRANHHFKKNEFEKAIGFYNETIEKLPEFADAYNNRGLVYEKMGDLVKAQQDYERAIAKDKDFFQAKYNLANLLNNSNNADEAKKLIDELKISSYKDSSQYYALVGNYYLQKNDFGQAISSFNQSLQRNQKNEEALSNLGFSYFQMKEYEKSIEFFEKTLQVNPKSTFALNNIGLIYSIKENFPQAAKYLQQAFDFEKVNPIYMNNYAFVLISTGKVEEGKELIVKSLEKNRDNAWAYRNLGVYYLQTNNMAEALKNFQEAEKIDPSVDKIYYYLGISSHDCKYFKIGAKLDDQKCVAESKKCQ